MQAVFDKQDYQKIADEVLKLIKADYELVPKHHGPQLIGLEEFRRKYGHDKSPAWLKLYLLPEMPGVYGLNAGKGHPVKIDDSKASQWLAKHEEAIDWNRPLPK